MKKIVIFTGIILIMIMACNKGEPDKITALKFLTPYVNFPEFLNGQIKTVKEINYWAIEKDDGYIKGEVITRKERDSISWSNDFTAYFNENGVLTRIDNIFFEGEIRSFVTEIEDGLITRATYVKDDTNRIYIVLEYDENEFVKSSKRFRERADTLLSKYSFVTNEDGFITESKLFDSKGVLTFYYKFRLNENNLTVNLKTYSDSDSLLTESRVKYNDKGFYTNENFFNGRGEIRRNIEIEYTDYDDMGNWLCARVFDTDKLSIITERVYEYY